tara:strand:- start:716 stop:835 length:120 start_codon:yes stop_codon:yes gene_type:complete
VFVDIGGDIYFDSDVEREDYNAKGSGYSSDINWFVFDSN